MRAGANNPAWRGGHVEYRGENWPTQRTAARNRDQDTCQRCGMQRPNLPVHHRRPYRLFATYQEANDLANLVTLCPPCHSQAEAEFWRDHPELADAIGFPAIFVPRTCRQCSTPFTAHAARQTLCETCRVVRCEHCGATFTHTRGTNRAIRFCSIPCWQAVHTTQGWRHRPLICEGCGEAFYSKHKAQRYCSQRCHISHDPPDQYRQVVRERKCAAQT